MFNQSLANPTEQFLTRLRHSLNAFGRYAKQPSGMAIIGSIGLHAVVAVALPSWSKSSDTSSAKKPAVVRVVALPSDIQSRLPASAPPIDLSVFNNNPNFNLDLSGVNRTGLDPNGKPAAPNASYVLGLNNLPTPMLPNSGSKNFSFVPNSPPSINSTFSGFAPPPPSIMRGLLPPPPNFVSRGGTANFSSVGSSSNLFPPSNLTSNGQQEFTITPKAASSLVERQRQLESQAAIALNSQTFSPKDPSVQFDAELLKPSELRNGASSGSNTASNSAIASRSIAGNYPKGACSSQASGTAVYDVTVLPSGAPSQWSLAQSSGTNALDNQASQDIRNNRFDGSSSNYRVSVGYRYQATFCAAFIPKATPVTKPTSQTPVTKPTTQTPVTKPTTQPTTQTPAIAPPTPVTPTQPSAPAAESPKPTVAPTAPPVVAPKPEQETLSIPVPATEPVETKPPE